jgi:hypothetical protein
LRDRYRLPLPPEAETHRSATLDAARAVLDAASFQAARAAGGHALLDTVVDEVLGR